ncbi:MAG: SWIM zinc finger family protein [Elusimicrobia bacterium]|nr:SWIM zinc finger family protein [Elusimicrobiota bacterium]
MSNWRRRYRYRERYSWDYYERSTPRAAEGGIKAQTAHGSFGKSWWGRRWIEVLESFGSNRIGRGRSYARSGQVLNIRTEKGQVTAEVQGSRTQPYQVTIRMKTLRGQDLAKLVKHLSRKAVYAAKLLAGEMPQEIEEVFRKAGVALFPGRLSDIHSDCSCPDDANPCKHIAAVYYLIGEEFDRDPSLIFKLRGIELEKLLSGLDPEESGRKARPTPHRSTKERLVTPVPADPDVFWGSETLFTSPKVDLRTPPVDAPLLKQLGNFPFWRGEERFLPALEGFCKAASLAAVEILIRSVRDQTETT